MKNIYVIGGANVDIYAKTKNEVILQDSNPSKITFSYGGVARNIAENLANLKMKVNFISAFGSDAFAKDMKEKLVNKGVNISYSIISKEHNSSIYLAILNKEDMFIGASDMDVLDSLNDKYLSKFKDVIKEDDYLIFDSNLKEETIEYIANNLKGIKIVDAISANKVVKLLNVLDKLDVLKLNIIEAQKIAGKDLTSDEKIEDFIKELNNKVKEVIVTKSVDLFIGINKEVKHYCHHSYVENPINVTGAGDALLATYIYAKSQDYSVDLCAKLALAAAIINVNDENAVSEMNLNILNDKAREIKIEKL